MVADLTHAPELPSDTYDCVICTQTLLLIYDVRAAVATLHRILKPGGTLLATVPGVSQICHPDMESWGDYWRFTSLSARRLFEEFLNPSDVTIDTYGRPGGSRSLRCGRRMLRIRPGQLRPGRMEAGARPRRLPRDRLQLLRGRADAHPRPAAPSGPLPLLYASVLSGRKGAETLIEAMQLVGDRIEWDLVVAGPVEPAIATEHRPFFADPRIQALGRLSRPDIKAQMIARGVFVFPSYVEGSARAVFEALACGCYVITTQHAGSIVEDGVHGARVPAGDAEALAAAIVAADADRERIAEIGNRNAELIAASHRQSGYGDALARIYARLDRARS